MTFNKTFLAAALIAAFATPAMSAELVNFYGKANLSAQISDDGDGSYSEINSNASRLGVHGGLEVKPNLSVIYKVEVGVEMDDNEKDTFTDRDQYIGIKGDFGSIVIGQNYNALKMSQACVDQFNDLNGDLARLWLGGGEGLNNDSINYKSPKFNNFNFNFTYVTEGSDEGEDGYSAALTFGDSKLKKQNIYAAIATEQDVKGYDINRATLATKLAGIQFGFLYQDQQHDIKELEMDGFLVSVAYDINDFKIKGQVQTADVDTGDDRSGYSLGLDYKLAKNAKVYGFFTTFDMDSFADRDYLGTGIEFIF